MKHYAPCNECQTGFDSCFPPDPCCIVCDHTKPEPLDAAPVEMAADPTANALRNLAASRGVDLETAVRAAESGELARIVKLPLVQTNR